jgi:hypothetical protein
MSSLPVFTDAMRVFMQDHAQDDIARLGLVRMPDDWPRVDILDQIKARQKMRHKNPDWAMRTDLILPAPDLVEQSSSQATAQFKASLIQPGLSFVDLTAGCGVDCAALAPHFKNADAVEMNSDNAACLAHNLNMLGHNHVRVHALRAEDFIKTMGLVDLAYIDPQRRNSDRRGIIRFADMSPNILDLWPILKEKTKQLLIKTAPHLDIDFAIAELGDVSDVHIIEWDGDCKEVLLYLQAGANNPRIHAYRIDNAGKITHQISATRAEDAAIISNITMPRTYLYEPGPAFMKSGLYRIIGAHYGLGKLHPSTHLYTSDDLIRDFPGRVFRVKSITAADRKFMPDRANLTLRNFPGTTDDLRKKLKLQDGGDDYLFACTLMDERKIIIHTEKP